MGDFRTVVRNRRSVRRYLSDPVPDATLREILDEACWAPSWGNTQSTSVFVLSGDTLARLKERLLERAVAGAPGEPDIEMPAPPSWPEPYRARTADFVTMRTAFVAEEEQKRGIAPADPPVSPPVAGAGLIGAPHLLLICTTEGVSVPYSCFDAGLFAQTVALAAADRGLGTCVMAGVVRHPDLFRALIPESEDLRFIAALTIGYPDREAAVNQFPRQRAGLDERAFFIGA